MTLPNRYPLWILAGGRGSRIGIPKGLVKIQGKFWLEHLIKRYDEIGGSEIWIALGASSDSYYESIPQLPKPGVEGKFGSVIVNVVINDDWEKGQFSSLITIIENQTQFKPAWIIPVDGFIPTSSMLQDLESKKFSYLAIIPTYNGKRGHPVLVDPLLYKKFGSMNKENPNSRLDNILNEIENALKAEIQVIEPCVLINLNLPQDWENLTSYL